jgi:hypothetical protein
MSVNMSHDLPLLPAKLQWTKDRFTYHWQAFQGQLRFRRYLSKSRPRFDLWKLRSDYLRTKPTARDLARFLDRYKTRLFSVPIKGDEYLPKATDGVEDIGLLTEGQNLINELLRHPGKFGAQDEPLKIRLKDREWILKGELTWRDGLPAVQLEPRTLFEALIWTAIIDRLRKVKFGVCRQCGAHFPITSQRKRKFCTYACAHLFTVRASRRGKVKAKPNTKQGGN